MGRGEAYHGTISPGAVCSVTVTDGIGPEWGCRGEICDITCSNGRQESGNSAARPTVIQVILPSIVSEAAAAGQTVAAPHSPPPPRQSAVLETQTTNQPTRTVSNTLFISLTEGQSS